MALPAVVDKKGPLEYRVWRPGDPLIDGVWGIPIPEKRDIGCQQRYWRRSWASTGDAIAWAMAAAISTAPWPPSRRGPWRSASASSCRGLETIHPQDFDIPMDLIVTEAGLRRG